MNFMFDTEGLSTRHHTLTTHVAGMAFHLHASLTHKRVCVIDVLAIELNALEQHRLGAVIDPDTVGWWLTQSDEARAKMASVLRNKNAEPLSASLDKIDAFVARNAGAKEDNVLWAQGPGHDYDRAIEAIYTSLNREAPWQYWQLTDSRTVTTLWRTVYGVKTIRRTKGHTALADVAAQIRTLVELLTGGSEIPPWDGTIYKP